MINNHDSTVTALVNKLEEDGYEVMADVEGFPKPSTIFGYIPDIFARKGAKVKIIEVETHGSYRKDIYQRKVFRKFASLDKDRSFKTIMVKE